MKFSKEFFFFLALCLIFHSSLLYYKIFVHPDPGVSFIEQERFSSYVLSLQGDSFPKDLNYFDTRFFPGLVWILYLINILTNNYFITSLIFIFFVLIIFFYVLIILTKNPFYAFLLTIFPPIVFEQSSKVSTETVSVMLILFSYYLFFNKKRGLAFFIVGISSIIRPFSAIVVVPMVYQLLKENKFSEFTKGLFFLATFPVLMFLYNQKHFGDIFYQIKPYSEVAGGAPGVFQFITDYFSFFINGKYGVIASASFYIFTSLFLLIFIMKSKKDFVFKDDKIFVKVFLVLSFLSSFIINFSGFPILADVRRFLILFMTFALVAVHKRGVKPVLILPLSLVSLLMAFF